MFGLLFNSFIDPNLNKVEIGLNYPLSVSPLVCQSMRHFVSMIHLNIKGDFRLSVVHKALFVLNCVKIGQLVISEIGIADFITFDRLHKIKTFEDEIFLGSNGIEKKQPKKQQLQQWLYSM